jgi:hypothetical protein
MENQSNKTILTWLNNLVRGFSNTITLHLTDRLEAGTEAMLGSGSYDEQLAKQCDWDARGGPEHGFGEGLGLALPWATFLRGARGANAVIASGGLEKLAQTASSASESFKATALTKFARIDDDVARGLSMMASDFQAESQAVLQAGAKFAAAHPRAVSNLMYGAAAAKGVVFTALTMTSNPCHSDDATKPSDTPNTAASPQTSRDRLPGD